MTPHTTGIVGSGKVGTVLARLSAAAGLRTLVAGSAANRAILDLMLGVTAPGATPAGIEQIAAEADLIILVVQFRKSESLPYASFAGRVVIDAMNYWPPLDGTLPEIEADPRSTSEIVAARMPESYTVKSLNHLGYHDMDGDARPAGDPARRAIALATDHPKAADVAAAYIDAIGFDPVVLDSLAAGRMLQPGEPAFGQALSCADLTQLLLPSQQRLGRDGPVGTLRPGCPALNRDQLARLAAGAPDA
jgi:8-hydroxy-5-deazaflavin:NADPH oxidoreductase